MRAAPRLSLKLATAALATTAVVGALAPPAFAADTAKTWTGESQLAPGQWSDGVGLGGSNWDPEGPPASDAALRLLFPATAGTKNMTNDVGVLTLAGLDFAGADYVLGGSGLVLGGGTENKGAINHTVAGTNTLNVPLTIGAPVSTASGATLVLGGAVGGGGFAKQGAGLLRLTASNSFTGPLTIAAGTVQITNLGALGTAGSGAETVVQPGGALELAVAFSQIAPFLERLQLSGAGANPARGALYLGTPTGTTPTITGPVQLVAAQGAPAAVVGIDGGSAAFAPDALSGSGGLTKIGDGVLAFLGGNSYAGPTTVAGGTLRLTSDPVAGDPGGGVPGALVVGDGVGSDRVETIGNARFGGAVTVNLGGVLDLVGFNAAPTSVALNGGRIVNAAVLTLGGDLTASVPNGSPADVNAIDGDLVVDEPRTLSIGEGAPPFDARITGTITGEGAITKTGDGTLLINGPVAMPVTVSAGGLAGFGDYADDLTIGSGTLKPGQSPGRMSVGGDLGLGSGARLEIELGGTSAGSTYDQVVVSGAVDLANATLDVLPLFTSTGGDTFTIISNTGSDAVQGTFASLAEGASVLAGSRRYSITYKGGDGNDVVLRDLGAVAGADTVTRLQGSDRIDTAVAASKSSYPTNDSAKAAVLARSTAFPDALGGAALATAKDGPLLLTPETGLDARTRAELSRVLPSGATVFVLGGSQALSPGIDSELRNAGFTVTRLAGADRYETAVRIADQGLGNPSTLLLATGQNFPDALAGGAAAARVDGAVLLTEGSTLPAATRAYLDAHPTAVRYALGGPAASAVPAATAVSGADRYETAVAVARRFFTAPSVAGVASGVSFPDALSGGAHIGRLGGPMLLTAPSSVPTAVSTYLSENRAAISGAFVYGGPVAVAESVVTAVKTGIT